MQFYCLLKSVGVVGDERRIRRSHSCANRLQICALLDSSKELELRQLDVSDFMTSKGAGRCKLCQLSKKIELTRQRISTTKHVSNRIVNEIESVSRVVYDISK